MRADQGKRKPVSLRNQGNLPPFLGSVLQRQIPAGIVWLSPKLPRNNSYGFAVQPGGQELQHI